MRKLGFVLMQLVPFVAPNQAFTVRPTSPFPRLSYFAPFSPESNFMSSAGFLRWYYYVGTTHWLSNEEAVNEVKRQLNESKGQAP